MKYLYKTASLTSIKTALWVVLFLLLIVGQMSCTSKTATKLETGENSLFLCKFVTPDGVTKNTSVLQRTSMFSPGDTIVNSKYGTWIIVAKQATKQ